MVERQGRMKVINEASGNGWALYNADSCELLREFPDCSIDMSVFSPPFASLYTYSPSERDLGNCANDEEFFAHFSWIATELLRLTKPGRICAVHVSDIPAMAVRDGYIGLKDFSGDVIRLFIRCGWIFDARVPVDKNQQALRDGTNVLTPAGWRPIESLRETDSVIGSDGKPCGVRYVQHFENRMIYEVSFSDGSAVECDANHLWTVTTLGRRYSKYNPGSQVVMRTDELMEAGLYSPSGRPKFSIPILSSAAELTEQQSLPLDPYLMGVILGDGCVSQRSVAAVCTEHEVIEKCQLPAGHRFARLPGSDRGLLVSSYNIYSDFWHDNKVIAALRDLGLQGKRAWEKSIPDCYLYANAEHRWELLRGLLDTDGSIRKNGSVIYNTTSYRLAQDVRAIVLSLGGLANIQTEATPSYVYKDERRTGRPQWAVSVQLETRHGLFKIERKAARQSVYRKRKLIRSIVGIRPVGIDSCTCISVDAEDQLFVTEDYVLTHNSQSIRTHAKGLTMTQMEKDRTWSRPALPDYILKFRRPGDNAIPVCGGDITRDLWIDWANPTWPGESDRCLDAGAHATWYGISETDTLQAAPARDGADERHICPLQLGTIERCIRLWSNAGETVLTPFAGIGSEVYEAVRLSRRGVGIELKTSYWRTAVDNLRQLEHDMRQPTLFDEAMIA